jgi:hypothetical protein
MKLYRKRGLTRMEPWNEQTNMDNVTINQPDRDQGSPKRDDMVAQRDQLRRGAMTCPHELWERESALADGYCSLCLANENRRLRTGLLHIVRGTFNRGENTRYTAREYAKVLLKGELLK